MGYLIGPGCVGCNYCFAECPASAIDYDGAQFQIIREKCTDCGLCAELCPAEVIINPIISTPQPERHDPRRITCDLLVLGAGGSGLVAAAKAAEIIGKSIIVLEKAKKPGGDSNLAHGFRISGSRVQASLGLPVDTEEEIRRKLRGVKWQSNPKLVSKAIRSTGEFFDWLYEMKDTAEAFRIGEFFGTKTMIFPNRRYENLKSRDQSIGPGWTGTFIVHKMLEKCEQLGVKILTGHRAEEIKKDDGGKICGVLASDPGGQTLIDCKACIIATGGFGHSEKWLKKIFPEYFIGPVFMSSTPSHTGDGYDMAEKLGAFIDYDNIEVSLIGPDHRPFSHTVNRIKSQPETVFINLNGKRWIDEESDAGIKAPTSYVVSKQPRGIVYSVMDEKILEMIGRRLIENPPDGNDGWIFRDYSKDIEKELAMGYPAKKADTLEKLAVLIGVATETFVNEIKKYNEFCKKGADEDFFKRKDFLVPLDTPPYYAFYNMRHSHGSSGGITVDEKIRVLDLNSNIIPGLYAVGDVTHGPNSRYGDVVCAGLSWAAGSGYIAAQCAAEYILEQ